MKKIKRVSTRNDLAKYDNLFIKNTISLDDPTNMKNILIIYLIKYI